jgi:iron-sulfur cluster repair protein YtfE (RIC family)
MQSGAVERPGRITGLSRRAYLAQFLDAVAEDTPQSQEKPMEPEPVSPVNDDETFPRPSAVRERILGEHVRLREQLGKLQVLAAWLRDDPAPLLAVQRVSRRLLAELDAHIQLEDTVLAPALRDVDAWGPIRERELLTHHVEQRNLLHQLLADYDTCSGDCPRVAELTLSWISDVVTDMDHEERSIISQNLLRDDLVAVDVECG